MNAKKKYLFIFENQKKRVLMIRNKRFDQTWDKGKKLGSCSYLCFLYM